MPKHSMDIVSICLLHWNLLFCTQQSGHIERLLLSIYVFINLRSLRLVIMIIEWINCHRFLSDSGRFYFYIEKRPGQLLCCFIYVTCVRACSGNCDNSFEFRSCSTNILAAELLGIHKFTNWVERLEKSQFGSIIFPFLLAAACSAGWPAEAYGVLFRDR